MRYLKYFSYLLLVCLFTASCTKLQNENSSIVPLDKALNSIDDLRLYVYSLYKPFASSNGDDQVWGFYATLDAGYYSITDNTTDILTTQKANASSVPTLCNLHNWQLNSSNLMNPLTNKYWSKVTYISKARMAAIRINATSFEPSIKKPYVAEAKAVIGWLGMILYDVFGPVPFATDEQLIAWDKDPLSSTHLPKPTDQQFLAYIESNLQEAIPDLPVKQADWGRITKASATMMLMRIHFMQRDYVKAKSDAEALYAMGVPGGGTTYNLQDEYQNIFKLSNAKNNEIIQAIPCDGSKDGSPNQWYCAAMPKDYPHISPNAKGSSTHRMRWAYYDTYELTDDRLKTIVSKYTNTSGTVVLRGKGELTGGAIPFKYDQDPNTNGNFAHNDVVVFRYAEVLLSYAEAINEISGPTAQAVELVNKVRRRAKLKNLQDIFPAKIATQAAFRGAILEERGHELYCEGVRHMDLVRYGKFVQNGKLGLSTSDQALYNIDPLRYRFPIPPDAVIQSGGVIKQNDGY
ncbi:MAG TPA: RagB/SusD family nutrient uptake outer membrane protein [Chitinophagaceae bacterium]